MPIFVRWSGNAPPRRIAWESLVCHPVQLLGQMEPKFFGGEPSVPPQTLACSGWQASVPGGGKSSWLGLQSRRVIVPQPEWIPGSLRNSAISVVRLFADTHRSNQR